MAGNEEYPEYEERVIQIIEEMTEEVYILAFENGQYVPRVKEKFKNKYTGNVIKASTEEIKEISSDLIIIYILPKDLSWAVLFDHDGNFDFTGEIKEKAEKEFTKHR